MIIFVHILKYLQNMNDTNNNLSERLKKGEGFVQSKQDSITFMEINEIEQSTSSMDICIVTWYSLNKKGVTIQRRFPMAARDGKFCDFEPITRLTLKEAKKAIRDFNAKINSIDDNKNFQRQYTDCCSFLRNLIGERVETSATLPTKEQKLITNQWFDCSYENNWIEENQELGDKYLSIVCLTHDTSTNKEGKPIAKQFVYTHDFCPLNWNTLVECGAKYMVIEKPEK